MDLPITDYTDQYVQFCEKAGLPINEVPATVTPIDVAIIMK